MGVSAIVATAGIVATTAFIGSAQDKRDSYTSNANSAIENAEASSLALGAPGIVDNSVTYQVTGTDSFKDGNALRLYYDEVDAAAFASLNSAPNYGAGVRIEINGESGEFWEGTVSGTNDNGDFLWIDLTTDNYNYIQSISSIIISE